MAKMKTPTLEEVKEYFKDAKKIESCYGEKLKYKGSEAGFVENTFMNTGSNNATIWTSDKGYAKILSYKEPKEKTYKITREQILELSEKFGNDNVTGLRSNLTTHLKNEFPEVFETKPEVGKWMITPKNGLYCPKERKVDGFLCYGFNVLGKWDELFVPNSITKDDKEATEQVVTEALTKEAVKMGFKEGVYFKTPENGYSGICSDSFIYNSEYNILYCGSNAIFNKGQWAEILETLTIQEAEAKLNCKIV